MTDGELPSGDRSERRRAPIWLTLVIVLGSAALIAGGVVAFAVLTGGVEQRSVDSDDQGGNAQGGVSIGVAVARPVPVDPPTMIDVPAPPQRPAAAATEPPAEGPPVVQMTDEEFVAVLDEWTSRHLEGTAEEPMGDGAFHAFVLASELLGGQGDPRGVDTWSSSEFETTADLAAFVEQYLEQGYASPDGYLLDSPRLAELLNEVAARVNALE